MSGAEIASSAIRSAPRVRRSSIGMVGMPQRGVGVAERSDTLAQREVPGSARARHVVKTMIRRNDAASRPGRGGDAARMRWLLEQRAEIDPDLRERRGLVAEVGPLGVVVRLDEEGVA